MTSYHRSLLDQWAVSHLNSGCVFVQIQVELLIAKSFGEFKMVNEYNSLISAGLYSKVKWSDVIASEFDNVHISYGEYIYIAVI